MKIYDQHLHTFLSSDSHERFENYLKIATEHGLTHFVSTEHLDLSCRSLGRDDIPDLRKMHLIIQELQKKYNITILKGIELGYKFSRLKDIEAIVNTENFDVIIMSIHENEDVDCINEIFSRDLSPDEAYDAYLNLYVHMLNNCSCFDIVGHVDFLLRYIGRVDINEHESKLTALFNLVIEKDKSLEFNTRFIYRFNDTNYLKYIFSLYYACGGRKVSLGSDAHTVEDYLSRFDVAIALLKEIGFTHISTYQKRIETKIEIKTVR